MGEEMIFIAHRGNINGKEPEKENRMDYLLEALNKGYDIEIDLWYDNKQWWLGHDEPKYKTGTSIFKKAWCHAKNKEAFVELSKMKNINYFWHDKDDYTLTSKGYIWCQMGRPVLPGSICIMPEKRVSGDVKQCYGVCSDIVKYWRTVW